MSFNVSGVFHWGRGSPWTRKRYMQVYSGWPQLDSTRTSMIWKVLSFCSWQRRGQILRRGRQTKWSHLYFWQVGKCVLSYHNRKGLQWLPILLVCVVPQQLPFFLVLIVKTLHKKNTWVKTSLSTHACVGLTHVQLYSYMFVCFLQKQWSCVGRWWCFQLGTEPWGCAPHRRM